MKTEALDLYALKYFFDSVEAQSLTKAADVNFVTRSAISQSIMRLEQWAGFALTTHEKKVFCLTPQGEDFFRKMKSSYQAFEKMIQEPLRNSKSLRIGCSASLAEAFLFPTLKKMKAIESLNLITGTSHHLEHQWNEGQINLAMTISERHFPTAKTVKIHSGHFVLASKSGELTSRIITTESRGEVISLKKALIRESKSAISFLTVESWSLAEKLAAEIGVACLIPDFMLGAKLKKIPLKGFRQTYHVQLIHRSKEHLSEYEAQLIDQLK